MKPLCRDEQIYDQSYRREDYRLCHIGPLIKEVFIKAFFLTNILKGFEKSRIYPFNNGIFSVHEFMGDMAVITFSATADSIIQSEVASVVRQKKHRPCQMNHQRKFDYSAHSQHFKLLIRTRGKENRRNQRQSMLLHTSWSWK